MVKQMLKKKSKRIPAKKRYKIEKKVREHNRKLRKMKKGQIKKIGRKKIIKVPGDCPFKDQILMEAMEIQKKIQEEKKIKKEQLKAEKKKAAENPSKVEAKPREDKDKSVTNAKSENNEKPMTMEELMKRAQDRGYKYEKLEEKKAGSDPSVKAFYKEFKHVIKESDVIIEVLDARDPMGTRSLEAEENVKMYANKRLVMILNKSDLVPMKNVESWINYLKMNENCAVLAFKSNTQKQKNRLGSINSLKSDHPNAAETKKSVGLSDLLGLLGSYARGAAGGITVGVVGLPNVGKSSLINSLKRSRACDVGGKAGVTRTCQVVNLDSKLKLIDSPGICFSKDRGKDGIDIDTILNRVPKFDILCHYKIPDFKDTDEFLSLISQKYRQLKKGGVANTVAAEQKVINDWNTGAIKFYTIPPELKSTDSEDKIVTTLAPTFNVDTYEPMESDSAAPEKLSSSEAKSSSVEEKGVSDNTMDVDVSTVENSEVTSTPRRITRSLAAKINGTNIEPQVRILEKESKTRSSKSEGSSATPRKPKVALISSKKVVMKKMRKSKKKSTKSANQLAELVDNLEV